MKRMNLQPAAVDGPTTLIAIEESANGNAILQDLRWDPAAARFLRCFLKRTSASRRPAEPRRR